MDPMGLENIVHFNRRWREYQAPKNMGGPWPIPATWSGLEGLDLCRFWLSGPEGRGERLWSGNGDDIFLGRIDGSLPLIHQVLYNVVYIYIYSRERHISLISWYFPVWETCPCSQRHGDFSRVHFNTSPGHWSPYSFLQSGDEEGWVLEGNPVVFRICPWVKIWDMIMDNWCRYDIFCQFFFGLGSTFVYNAGIRQML